MRSLDGFLGELGVGRFEPATTPFDPGYDPVTLESHLAQSSHLMASLKISMACWVIADEVETRRKLAAARRAGVDTVSGGGLFEVAAAQGRIEPFLDLCAEVGFARIECSNGFSDSGLEPGRAVAMAAERGLGVQFELGRKFGGPIGPEEAGNLIAEGEAWLAAGAVSVVIEARESAADVGLFDAHGELDGALAERFAQSLGLERLIFEAPTKPSQFALISHLGPEVRLGNVRLEELLRVEIYRRGLHSDSFGIASLRPPHADAASL